MGKSKRAVVTVKVFTICNTVFPQSLLEGIQGPSRRRGNSLDSNIPHGAVQAFIDGKKKKRERKIQAVVTELAKTILQ